MLHHYRLLGDRYGKLNLYKAHALFHADPRARRAADAIFRMRDRHDLVPLIIAVVSPGDQRKNSPGADLEAPAAGNAFFDVN
jgi:hypothetical protein